MDTMFSQNTLYQVQLVSPPTSSRIDLSKTGLLPMAHSLMTNATVLRASSLASHCPFIRSCAVELQLQHRLSAISDPTAAERTANTPQCRCRFFLKSDFIWEMEYFWSPSEAACLVQSTRSFLRSKWRRKHMRTEI